MSTIITNTERTKLYTQLKHQLGAPIIGVELEDEMLDSLLELAVLDYGMYVQDWLIENQWSSLYDISIDEADLTRAFMTRSLDWETSFTYAYSKIVGLQTAGPWELKKDFVSLSANTQIYQIPAGREINEVLWFTPPTLDQSVIDPFIGIGGAFGAGFGGEGGLAQFGMGAYYVMPAFDVLLRQSDRNLKNRLIRGELTYKVTAAPNGQRYIWIMPVPGGRYDYGNTTLYKGKVWYRYYEITPDDEEEREACLEANQDVIKLPSDVPLDSIDYSSLNLPSKIWVRRYLLGLAKETLGRVRGKFSGALNVPGADVSMDYESLLSEGKEEQAKLIEELGERLTSMSNQSQTEQRATQAEAINKSLQYRPLGLYVI